MNYAVVDSDGRIVRIGSCIESDLALQGGPGLTVIETNENPKNCYYKDGQFLSMGKRPSNFHQFDYSNGRWFDNRSDQEKNNAVLRHIRKERNRLLRESDWTQMADSPLTETERATWATYRQQLRDLPAKCSTIKEISEIIFPTLEG